MGCLKLTYYQTTELKKIGYKKVLTSVKSENNKRTGNPFGFNGKENDNDVKGNGNQQDYGMRIYDTRLSRFLSVDPLADEYAFYTPYQFAGNRPIQAVDLDGLEPKDFNMGGNIFNAVGDGFIGIGQLFDDTFSWGTETISTTPLSTRTAGNITTSSGVEVKSTNESSSNFGGILSTLKNSGRAMTADELPNATRTTSTIKVSGYNQVDVKTTKGTLTTKTTANQTESKVEVSATVNIKVKKIPVDIKTGATKSTTGQADVKLQASTSSGNSTVKVGVTTSNNSTTGKSSVKVSLGAETKVGKTKVSTDGYIKIKTGGN